MATRLGSIHRFTTDEYEKMISLGIVPSDSADLIDGRVFVGGSLWRFSTADYYRLAEVGILTEDDRVELIEGEILDMAAIGSRHAGVLRRIAALLRRLLGDAVILAVQDPLEVQDDIQPQPDLMVLRPRADFYTESHPTPADVLLLIEVADTSIGYDRTEKADLYAAAGIAEYWLVDVARQRVFVHTGPTPAVYAKVEAKDVNDSWTSSSLPSLTVSGKDIFG